MTLNITTRTGLVGFFLMLSALSIPEALATTYSTEAGRDRPYQIESRLARLTAAIREREPLLGMKTPLPIELLLAGIGWANGGGGFANGRGGGFINGINTSALASSLLAF